MGIYIVTSGGSKSTSKYLTLSENELFIKENYDKNIINRRSILDRIKEFGLKNHIDIMHVCTVQYFNGLDQSCPGYVIHFNDPKQKILFKLLYNREEIDML
jgi:hypothetical protein